MKIESILYHKQGVQKHLSEHDERFLVRQIKKTSRLRAPKLAAEVKQHCNKDVSTSTIRRVLKKEGYNGRVARKKPYVNEVN